MRFSTLTGEPNSVLMSSTVSGTQMVVSDQITLTSIPVSGTHLANKTYVDGIRSAGPNLLQNPSFNFWQRGTTINASTTFPNNDDAYGPDRWNIISDGNNAFSFSRITSPVPSGVLNACQMQVETVNKKGGLVCILEARDTYPLRGRQVSFSLEAANDGNTVGQLAMGVVEWLGTADSVTSDIVSSWNAAGTRPTLATNWNYLNSNAYTSSTLTTTFSGIKLEGKTVSNLANNIAVFFITDDTTTTSGHKVYVSKCDFEPGSTFFQYMEKSAEEQLSGCQRYFEKAFDTDITPANGLSSFVGSFRTHIDSTSGFPSGFHPFNVAKRVVPTVTLYQPRSGGTAGQWTDGGTTSSANARAIQSSSFGVGLDNTNVAFPVAIQQVYIHWVADSEL